MYNQAKHFEKKDSDPLFPWSKEACVESVTLHKFVGKHGARQLS